MTKREQMVFAGVIEFVLAGLLILGVVPAAEGQLFQVAQQYPASTYNLATGDFNGDGKLDIASVNLSDNTVSVLLGNGDGSFQAPVEYPVGWNPYVVVVGDFNGDGKVDLAVSSFSAAANLCSNQCQSIVSILLGNGDGTFQPHLDFFTGGLTPVGMAAGDFNGDGKLDLVIANSQAPSNAVSVLLGNGDGTFQTPVNYSSDLSPLTVTVGDLNGDGKADLVVLNHDIGGDSVVVVSVFIGNGDGTFKARVDYNTSNGATGMVPNEIVIGDFRGNGINDLAVSSAYGVDVLLGNGNGTFQPFVLYSIAGDLCGNAITCEGGLAVGDFNGDGRMDLAAVVNNFQMVTVLLSNGDGTFRAPEFYVGTYGTIGPFTVVAGDVNGDRKPDLIAAGGPALSILLSNGSGGFDAARSFTTGVAPNGVASADFNGDGKLDLATANFAANTVSILLGHGDGTFAPKVDYSTANGPFSFAVGDFNGDGKPDLSLSNFLANSVSVLLGNGDGTFQPHTDYAVGAEPTRIALGDFNGDGKLDLAVPNCQSNTVSILLGNGDGTLKPRTDYPTGQCPVSVAVADLNGDGKLDLGVAFQGDSLNQKTNPAGVDIFINQGNGTFLPGAVYSSGGVSEAVASADFNGDGKQDLAVTNGGPTCVVNLGKKYCTNGTGLGLLLGNGDGTFRAAVTYATDIGPNWIVAADFDGDGKLDLATANLSSTTASIVLGNGDGTFRSPVNYEIGYQPDSLAVGDFNGDLKPDLAVSAAGNNSATMLLNTATEPVYILSATTSSAGGPLGMVFSQPAGLICGPYDTDCSAAYSRATSVTLLPKAPPGTGLTGWSGDCTGIGTCVLDMDADHSVTGNFSANTTTYTVTTMTSGSGTGMVGPIYNPGSCATGCSVSAGSLFILGATPNPGSVFDGWSGGGCSASMIDCNLTVNSNMTITVRFDSAVVLTVSLAGSGGGVVTSSPDGINCGSTCSANFGYGATLTLTAAPNPTSTFTGWSGACSGTGTCSVTMNAAQAVTATFAAENFSIMPASSTLTLQAAAQGTDAMTLAGVNGPFGGAIQLACSVTGPAPMPTCSVAPSSVTPGAGSAPSTLTVTASGMATLLNRYKLGRVTYALCLPLAFAIMILGKAEKQRRVRFTFCGTILLLLSLLPGCGGNHGPTNYTVTVTGTSGSIQHTAQITVTVQ